MTNFIIGIDGGQSSTQCALATTKGELLGFGAGGGLIHFAAQDSHTVYINALREAICAAWATAGLTPHPLSAIALGLTGVEANTPEANTALELLPQVVQFGAVDVQGDAVSALNGAHLGKPGIIIISGTGSTSLGSDLQGNLARVGGWGWLTGDEGSASVIGRSAVIAAFHSLDGWGPQTRLEEALMHHFGESRTYDVKRHVYASDFGARGFASLAPLVAKAAEEGDAVATQLIHQAGQDLAHTVMTLVRKLDFGDQPIPVAPVGGVFTHLAGVRAKFGEVLQEQAPAVQVVDPALPPVLGAVIMALKLGAEPLAQAVATLQRSYRTLD
ncbi:MAG: BadF/BadG/BcrA/BcrD ATPase family protein [Caldilineaceae bacterium]